MQEQRELELEEVVEELIDQTHPVETMRPIDSRYSIELRREATREAYRNAMQFVSATRTAPPDTAESRTEQDRIVRPNLEIPVGEKASLYLPQ